jgi:hypothetical protein
MCLHIHIHNHPILMVWIPEAGRVRIYSIYFLHPAEPSVDQADTVLSGCSEFESEEINQGGRVRMELFRSPVEGYG